MDNELRSYERYLRHLAETDSTDIISNGGKRHAALLYSALLDCTKNEVRIFCQSGASEVWHDPVFEKAMTRFFERDSQSSLKVLTAGEPALDSKWTNRKNVTAFHIRESDKEKIYDHFRNNRCNFAVFDSKRYRYEYDCNGFKAYGSFNDSKIAAEMIEIFDDAFANAQGSGASALSDTMPYTLTDSNVTIDSYQATAATGNEA